jgi:hypothetical protein
MRGAGAGLVHIDDELFAVFAGEHFVGGGGDRVGTLGVEASGFLVRQRRRALDAHDGVDERRKRFQSADREVADRAERLDAVERVVRNLERAEWIALGAGHGETGVEIRLK